MVPGLILWRRAAAALSALVFGLIGLGLAAGAPPSQTYYDFNLRRLQEFRAEHDPRQPGTLRVVMLGSSRLKNATIDADVFDKLAKRHGFARIDQFRLVANWAVFRNFAPLLDDMRALKPDVYVIQMDLLLEEMAPTFESQLAFNYLRWLTAGAGPWSWYEPREEQLGLVCTDEGTPEVRAARAALKLKDDPEAESPRLARAFIRDVVLTDGAQVLLVSVPKSSAFERLAPSAGPAMLSAAQRLARDLPRVTMLPYRQPLSDDHFCDVAHLNRRGAEIYTGWLVDQIAAGAADVAAKPPSRRGPT
jgi:hypothetical protein